MASRVRIVTDSTSCLPADLVERYGISILPVGLVIDGKVYRDCIDITLTEICQQIDNLDKRLTTAAVNPGEFFNTFSELAELTDSIICILVSKALTATQESAYQARRMIRAKHPNLPDLKFILQLLPVFRQHLLYFLEFHRLFFTWVISYFYKCFYFLIK